MFYSHEILTSRKYGVATIWLIATLGSKSALKKINRKAILEVDVPKACETIMTTEVPMALRLQSNLLYGVSKVFAQQCGYVLADAQNAQNHIRALLKAVKAADLDPEAGKARPEQLILQDDPTFMPDLLLPISDLDLADFDLGSSIMSQGRYTDFLSTLTSLQSVDSLELQSSMLANNDISSGNDGVGNLNFSGLTDSSPRENAQPGPGGIDDIGFMPDVDFEFDAEGNYVEIDAAEQARRREMATTGVSLRSDSNVSAQVRREHEEGFLAGPHLAISGDPYIPMDDDFGFLPEAEPFHQGRLASDAPHRAPGATPLPQKDGDMLDATGAAPLLRRRGPKIIPMDSSTELRNSDLAQWNNDYVKNMDTIIASREHRKILTEAKKAAEYWVWNRGISGIGQGFGASRLIGPLEVFAGDKLKESILQLSGDSRKRSIDDVSEEEEEEIRDHSRRRSNDLETGMAMDVDDGGMPILEDDGIEVGRAAPENVEDTSSAMPWNIGSSIQGSRHDSIGRPRNTSGSIGGFSSAGGPGSTLDQASALRRRSGLISASPLVGRGRLSGLERLSSLEMDDNEGPNNLDSLGTIELGEYDEFELYGPGAAVDTQTAAQTQWIKETLDRESYNFLDFVKTSTEKTGSITFGELLPPKNNTKVVAAQGLLHTLQLATRNLITVRQDEHFGAIEMQPLPRG